MWGGCWILSRAATVFSSLHGWLDVRHSRILFSVRNYCWNIFCCYITHKRNHRTPCPSLKAVAWQAELNHISFLFSVVLDYFLILLIQGREDTCWRKRGVWSAIGVYFEHYSPPCQRRGSFIIIAVDTVYQRNVNWVDERLFMVLQGQLKSKTLANLHKWFRELAVTSPVASNTLDKILVPLKSLNFTLTSAQPGFLTLKTIYMHLSTNLN